MFTGDRSGDWLFRALHKAGLANQPTSVSADDGLTLRGVRVTSAVHCAPPANRPTPSERDCCASWLQREFELLTGVTVVVALGQLAYGALCGLLGVRPRPRFGHGVQVRTPAGPELVGSYHPSQQNTFTGRLTEPMIDEVFERAVHLAGRGPR
jgi:uracil-DNA glycosylase family 4